MGKAIGLLAGLLALIVIWRLGRYLRPPARGADPAQRWLSAGAPDKTRDDAPVTDRRDPAQDSDTDQP